MEKNQKINCAVESCIYNDENAKMCTLQAIQVAPTQNCKTRKPEESMCASYESEE